MLILVEAMDVVGSTVLSHHGADIGGIAASKPYRSMSGRRLPFP